MGAYRRPSPSVWTDRDSTSGTAGTSETSLTVEGSQCIPLRTSTWRRLFQNARIHVFFLVIALGGQVMIFGQGKDPTLPFSVKNVSLDEIYSADTSSLLDRSFYPDDKLTVLSWKGRYWFTFRPIGYGVESKAVEVFTVREDGRDLRQVTAHLLYGTWPGITDLYVWDSTLLHVHYSYRSDPIGHLEMIAIESARPSAIKQISLKDSTREVERYFMDGYMWVLVEGMTRRLNWQHYVFFWLPRGRSPKWEYIPTGKRWLYKINRNCEIVEMKSVQ